MSQAKRDENFVPTLLGVSSVDGTTPIPVYADPVTHRLLVDSATSVTPGGSNTDVQFNDNGSFGGVSAFTFDKSAGGDFVLTNGDATSGNNTGGSTHITSGAGHGSGIGGSVILFSGIQASGAAGAEIIAAGAGDDGTDVGGAASISGGASVNNAIGGVVNITAGIGGDISGAGGSIIVSAGNARAGNSDGGIVTINAGDAYGAGNSFGGGYVSIVSGTGGIANADGGVIEITASDGGTTGGDGGHIQLTAGSSTAANGNGGVVTIFAGQQNGSGNRGSIHLNSDSASTAPSAGNIRFSSVNSTYEFGVGASARVGNLIFSSINTTSKNFTFPNQSGTIALTSDIPGLVNYADNETPTGTINGTNAVFTLAHTPNPAASLQLFLNGAFQAAAGGDYTLATATITFITAPVNGSTLRAFYRY